MFQQVVLARSCQGLPTPEDFRLEQWDVPDIHEGQFLVRHLWGSVDPGTRSRLSGTSSYARPLRIGDPIDGFNVGVIEKSRNSNWREGSVVHCAGGWRSHSLQNGRGLIYPIPRTDLPLSLWIGVLGIPGLTAWFGLKRVAGLKMGDRVLITSAAGPVGATAGQLAHLTDGTRVVGIAGSAPKCSWLTDTCRFHTAINRKTDEDLTDMIRNAMPDGVDVLFDNVGNAMIDRVLPMMRQGGRIVVSGQVADYNLPPDQVPGIHNTRAMIAARLRMEGLVVFDDAPRFPEALTSLANLVANKRIHYREERFTGIKSYPEAFCGLFTGDNFGRRVIELDKTAQT